MTPLALAREWARGEPGLGLYLGCLAIRKSGVGACTVVRVERMSGDIATIVPSTSASKSGRIKPTRKTPSSCASSPSNTLAKTEWKLKVAASALVLLPGAMLREILKVERREEIQISQGESEQIDGRKKKVTFHQAVSSGRGDGQGDGEVKGQFASEDIRMKKNGSVKVEKENQCNLAEVLSTTCVKTVKSGGGGELISWMEGLKSSDMLEISNVIQERGSGVIVDVRDEVVEEESQEDCFGEKNIDDWMKELQVQVEEEESGQAKVEGGIFDADDEGEEEEHISGGPFVISGEPELEEDCSRGILMPREENISKPCQAVDTHSEQNCPPEYLMKEGEVHRVKIFMADSPSNMVGRPVHLEKEYQELLDELSSLFSLKSSGTSIPIEGSFMAARVQGKGWVRAKVQEVTEGSCRVLLIDIGHEAWLPPSLLQPLLPSHCNLPQLAQAFHLKSVSPVGGGKKWTKSSIEMLADEVRFAEVEVKVLGPPVAKSSNSLLPSYPVSIEVPTLVAVNPMEPSSMVNRDLSSSLIEAGMALPARKREEPYKLP